MPTRVEKQKHNVESDPRLCLSAQAPKGDEDAKVRLKYATNPLRRPFAVALSRSE